MVLRNGLVNTSFTKKESYEGLSDEHVLQGLYGSNAIVASYTIQYNPHPQTGYRIISGKGNDSPERSDLFYINVYNFVRDLISDTQKEKRSGFFEIIYFRELEKWYYTMASVVDHNMRDLPSRLSIISLPIDDDSGFAHKARTVFEMDAFKVMNQERYDQLTKREKEVLKCIAEGMYNPEIGEKLFISRRTVEQHRKNLNRKLKPKSLTDLINYARAFDLI